MHSSDTISMMERNISKEVHYGSSMLKHLSLPWDMRQTTMSLSKAHGGGLAGQAQLGVARALLKVCANHRTPLKQEGLLTRDSRVVERKKVGLKKARNAPQYSKR